MTYGWLHQATAWSLNPLGTSQDCYSTPAAFSLTSRQQILSISIALHDSFFFSFLNIASYKCGCIQRNKTHIVTVHHRTKTEDSSFTSVSFPPTKHFGAPCEAKMERMQMSSAQEPRQLRDMAQWQQVGRRLQSQPSRCHQLYPKGDTSRIGPEHRKNGFVQRNRVLIAVRHLVPASEKLGSLKQQRWHLQLGDVPHSPSCPRHTSSPSLPAQAWPFLLRGDKSHLVQLRKRPRLPQKHQGRI